MQSKLRQYKKWPKWIATLRVVVAAGPLIASRDHTHQAVTVCMHLRTISVSSGQALTDQHVHRLVTGTRCLVTLKHKTLPSQSNRASTAKPKRKTMMKLVSSRASKCSLQLLTRTQMDRSGSLCTSQSSSRARLNLQLHKADKNNHN